ncbi:phytoene desaturase family protein [Pollutimonas bauzanensis]|uniref:Phytoene dehydrogenase-related protein n=1 Tax=Pollutimonas bauzanensis TaxID=658167 RepID=A0A1M5UN59_9BURK|nr:NAD(P)/FAD-dependent oxidoreductase [Pollutimonas bauzanensis]SHH64424.1 Phytoene dehydrogenase-related protein [Pollutimonas bauzanensis]
MGEKFDAIIVGGGPAGCAVGALLSKRGYKVALLEKEASVGGRASSFQHEGYTIDTGSHFAAAFEASGMKAIFEEVGAEMNMVPVTPTLMSFDLETRRYGPLTSKEKLGEDARDDYRAVRKIIKEMTREELEKREYHEISANEWISRVTSNPKVHDTFRRATGFAGASMSEVSAGAFIETMHDAWNSTHVVNYPAKGGCLSFSQALADRILANGGAVYTETAVKQVVIENGRVTGVKAIKTYSAGLTVTKIDFDAELVICAVPGSQLFSIVEKKALLPDLVSKVEAIIAEGTIYCGLLVGVKEELFDGFGDGQQFFQFTVGLASEHWHGLVTVPTYIDRSLAPPGRHYLICNSHGRLPLNRRNESAALHEKCLSALRGIWPGKFDENVEWLLRAEYMNVLYPPRIGRSGPFRPSLAPTGVHGLRIAGDYSYPCGSGYGSALKSARDCVSLIDSSATQTA